MENNEAYRSSNRKLAFISALVSSLISLGVGAFSYYVAAIGNYWFWLIGSYFLSEAAFILVPLFFKDEYKGMRFMGAIQIIHIILMMGYLLLMVLWNDSFGFMDQVRVIAYIVYSAAIFLKVLISCINRLIIKKNYNPLLHAYSNLDLIASFYLVVVIELIITNQFYPGEAIALLDNLLKEKPIWIYIIDLSLNATLTIFGALLALSTDIRSKTREQLNTVSKIKHTVKWINDNEVSMFMGLVFTSYLALLALINIRLSIFYIFLFIYYVGTASIRVINYLWHRSIVKRCKGNPIRENRKSSWILLVDSAIYLFFSNVVCIGAAFMMANKANAGTNIYMFLFMIIPMGIMRFVMAIRGIKNNRKKNNTYKLGLSLISLVCAFFSSLEIVAILAHTAPAFVRYAVIILMMIVVKIAVIVVAIIFVTQWFRSMIVNRHTKERRWRRQKEQEQQQLEENGSK